jgi:hypothetical protein
MGGEERLSNVVCRVIREVILHRKTGKQGQLSDPLVSSGEKCRRARDIDWH